MGLESGESFAQRFADRCDAIEEFVGFEVIEDGVACGGGNGMGLIGEAVHEGGCALFECVDDAGGVAIDGGCGSERGADDWFEDEGGDSGGVARAEKNLEVIGAS